MDIEGEDEDINRNALYERIFSQVWFRDRKIKLHPAGKNVEQDDFFLLMESLGLASWRGGGRTAGADDFVRIRKLYAPEKRREYDKLPSASLQNLTLQFFSREDQADDPGFEFIHKSFGEYLTARALINLGKRYISKLRAGEEIEFFDTWAQICGAEVVTSDIRDFIFLEYGKLSNLELEVFQQGLEEVCQALLSERFVGRVDGLGRGRSGTEILNALLAIISVLSSLPRFFHFIRKVNGVGFRPFLEDDVDGFRYLTYLSMFCKGHADDFSLLFNSAIFPAQTNLRFVSFPEMNLRRITAVELQAEQANLVGVAFDEAILPNANFSDCFLAGANFRRCRARGARFHRSDLTGSYFSGAKVTDAVFEMANLRGANFSSSDLSGCSFDGAVMIDANFTNCDVSAADFSRAIGLRQEQIRNAVGNARTKLPEGLQSPPKWRR
jgi:Pentapeptide repeats (8 copies)